MRSILDAPLASLVEPDVRVLAGAIIDEWDLPDADREALRTYGLPRGSSLEPAPQDVAAPLLRPNVAGDRERRFIAADERLYRLGTYGADYDASLTIRVGAVAGSGRVLGIRARPLTVADLHPQLRPYHPGLYLPAVCYFNASLAAFVEVAWRWYAAVEVFRQYREPDPVERRDEIARYHAEVARTTALIAERVILIDPSLADRDLDSAWVEEITEDD